MRLLEYERASWFYCILSTLQGTEAYLSRAAGQEKRRETHGKDEFLQAVLHTQFRLFGTFMLNNVNAGGSAICIRRNLLPDHAVVSHVTTFEGRDHIVTIRSGERVLVVVLVVVNVHFELDLVLRDLRERRRRISLHWPHCPEAFGVIIGDFNICEPEEGRFNVRSQTSTVTRRKRLFSVPFFRMLLKSHFQTLQGRIPPQMVRFAFFPESTGRSLMYLWLTRDFHMFLTSLENGPYRVIMSQYESSCRNRYIDVSKHPVLCAVLKRIRDGHQYPDEPSAALADFKVIVEKGRKQTHQELL